MDTQEGLRIVYLDDSEVQLRDVARALHGAGHTVHMADSITLAGRHIATTDLVIIDFHMPGLNGAESLPLLRKHVPHGEVVLFYLYTSDRNVATAYKSHGFDGAFTGKGNTDELVRQVDAARRMLKLKRFRQDRSNAG